MNRQGAYHFNARSAIYQIGNYFVFISHLKIILKIFEDTNTLSLTV